MSRGFGTTYGVGATDIITTSYTTAITGKRCYGIWFWDDGTLGASFLGRFFDKEGSENLLFDIFGTNVMEFDINFTGGINAWTVPEASTNTWHHSLIVYDAGSVSNDPVWYVDGVSQTVTNQARSSGTVSGNSSAFSIGNRASTPNRNYSGKLAWFSVWDGVLLTQLEATALARGAMPWRIRPASLVECVPLWGLASPEPQLLPFGTATVTGTAKQWDPPTSQYTPRWPQFAPFRFVPAMITGVAHRIVTRRVVGY